MNCRLSDGVPPVKRFHEKWFTRQNDKNGLTTWTMYLVLSLIMAVKSNNLLLYTLPFQDV